MKYHLHYFTFHEQRDAAWHHIETEAAGLGSEEQGMPAWLCPTSALYSGTGPSPSPDPGSTTSEDEVGADGSQGPALHEEFANAGYGNSVFKPKVSSEGAAPLQGMETVCAPPNLRSDSHQPRPLPTGHPVGLQKVSASGFSLYTYESQLGAGLSFRGHWQHAETQLREKGLVLLTSRGWRSPGHPPKHRSASTTNYCPAPNNGAESEEPAVGPVILKKERPPST